MSHVGFELFGGGLLGCFGVELCDVEGDESRRWEDRVKWRGGTRLVWTLFLRYMLESKDE